MGWTTAQIDALDLPETTKAQMRAVADDKELSKQTRNADDTKLADQAASAIGSAQGMGASAPSLLEDHKVIDQLVAGGHIKPMTGQALKTASEAAQPSPVIPPTPLPPGTNAPSQAIGQPNGNVVATKPPTDFGVSAPNKNVIGGPDRGAQAPLGPAASIQNNPVGGLSLPQGGNAVMQSMYPEKPTPGQEVATERNDQEVAASNQALQDQVAADKSKNVSDTFEITPPPAIAKLPANMQLPVLKEWYASLSDIQKSKLTTLMSTAHTQKDFADLAGDSFSQMAIAHMAGAEQLQKTQDKQNEQMKMASDSHNEAISNLTKEINDAKNMKYEGWFKKQGTGTQILSAIAVGLGSFGSGLQGIWGHPGPNVAMEMINKAITEDAQANREKWENQWKAIAGKRDLTQDTWNKDQFMVNKMNEDKLAGLEKTKLKVASYMDQVQEGEQKKSGQMMMAGLDGQIADLKDNMYQHRVGVAQQIDKINMQQFNAANAGGGAEIQRALKQYDTERSIAAKANKDPEKPIHFPGFTEWYKTSYSKGGALPGAGGNGSKELDTSIKELGETGQKAIKGSTPWNAIMSNLPRWIAPGANMGQDEVDQYNNTFLPGIARVVGDRVPPEILDKQVKSLQISSTMTEEQKKERVKAAQKFVQTAVNTSVAKRSKAPIEISGAAGEE